MVIVKSMQNEHHKTIERLRQQVEARDTRDASFLESSPSGSREPVPPHPVLEYQRNIDKGIHPANYKDPIRILDVAGPMSSGLYGRRPYGPNQGPILGKPQNIAVPMGSLKQTNERYNPDMFLSPGYRPNPEGLSLPLGSDFPPVGRGVNPSSDFYRPQGPNSPSTFGALPFYGNVDAYAPFQEINSPWEKAGLLVSAKGGCQGDSCRGKDSELLNLFRRAIAPVQDVWEYMVQDRDGFIIKLENRRFIENGDIVDHVIGKGGPYKAHMFVQNKYINV